jgi:hypothetical protein
LKEISEAEKQPVSAKSEALDLANGLQQLETAFMTVLWNRILSRFNKVSIYLQSEAINLGTATQLLTSLEDFVDSLRGEIEEIEEIAKHVMPTVAKTYKRESKRTVKQKWPVDADQPQTSTAEEVHFESHSQKFRLDTVIIYLGQPESCPDSSLCCL